MQISYCPHCGRRITDQGERCAACGRTLPSSSPGILGRLARLLFGARWSSSRATQVHVSRSQQIHIDDQATGERQVYTSLDDAPPHVREIFERARADAAAGDAPTTSQHFEYKDSDGVTRTYQSLDEMPPDVRAIFERLQQKALDD